MIVGQLTRGRWIGGVITINRQLLNQNSIMDSLVSFVLPAYKIEFLREAIDSILNQSYQKFELIIINDCSPYPVGDIVNSFTDDRIRYYVNEKNVGGNDLAGCFNQCMSYAAGELIIFASDDDIYTSDFLHQMILLSRKYTNVYLFHCRVARIDALGNINSYSTPAHEYESSIDFVYQRLFRSRLSPLQGFVFNRQQLVKIGGIVSFPMAWFSDDATCALMSCNGVAYCPKPLFLSRLSDVSISGRRDLYKQKIEATCMYKQWFYSFMENYECKTDDERIILNNCYKEFPQKITAFLYRYLREISLWQKIRLYHKHKDISIRIVLRSVVGAFYNFVRQLFMRG